MTGAAVRGGRLLIVDDDEGVTQTFASILRLEGHEVRAATNASEGLREVLAFEPDAIILDLRMPLVNGIGFLYRLRASGAEIPVAVITGDCGLSDELLSEMRHLGAQIHYKPLWTDALVALTGTLLARQGQAAHPSVADDIHCVSA